MAESRSTSLHVAKLARLALTPARSSVSARNSDALLEHVAALEKLPAGDVAATAQVIPATQRRARRRRRAVA